VRMGRCAFDVGRWSGTTDGSPTPACARQAGHGHGRHARGVCVRMAQRGRVATVFAVLHGAFDGERDAACRRVRACDGWVDACGCGRRRRAARACARCGWAPRGVCAREAVGAGVRLGRCVWREWCGASCLRVRACDGWVDACGRGGRRRAARASARCGWARCGACARAVGAGAPLVVVSV
jgi:hypothetical protein